MWCSMKIPNDLHEYQCLWFIPEDVILKFAWFELDEHHLIKGCEDKAVVDFWAWLSKLSSRFLNAKSINAIDPMYFAEEDELGNNGFKWTSAVIANTLKKLLHALLNNEEIKYRVDFYWRMNWPCETIEQYKQSVMKLIEDYHDRGEYLVWAEEALRYVPKCPSAKHIEDGSVDIVFLNALLFDSDYPFNILNEANRILSESWEIIIVDYKNIWKNMIFQRIERTDIQIAATDANFYCAKLKKDEFMKINLWRGSSEKIFPNEELEPSSPNNLEDKPINFDWKEISRYQKVDWRYLLELAKHDPIVISWEIDRIIDSLPIKLHSDWLHANDQRKNEFEEILRKSMSFIESWRNCWNNPEFSESDIFFIENNMTENNISAEA